MQQRQRQPPSLQSGRLQQEQLTLPGSLAADQSQRLSSSSRKHKKRRRSSSSSEDDSSSSDSSSSGSSGSDSDSSRDRSRRRRGSRRTSSRDRKERRGRKSSSKDKVRQGCVIPGYLYCETAPASGLRSALITYASRCICSSWRCKPVWWRCSCQPAAALTSGICTGSLQQACYPTIRHKLLAAGSCWAPGSWAWADWDIQSANRHPTDTS